MTEPFDLVAALTPVAQVLDRLGVPYQVGGSLASSVYGAARTTMDIDLTAPLEERHANAFARALRDRYYVDADMIREAVRDRSSFNVIHLPTMCKVDIFIPKDRPYDMAALDRRRRDRLAGAAGGGEFFVSSPEDVILAKLEWYERGGRTSERQWQDVLGVLRVQGDALDLAYLRRWARELALDSLLERALQER